MLRYCQSARKVRTVKRPEGRAPVPILVGVQNAYPADQNCREQRCERAVPIGWNRRFRSVQRGAGGSRRVACASNKPFFKQARKRPRFRRRNIVTHKK